MAMQVKVEGKKMTIVADIDERVSSSQKTILVASDTVKVDYKGKPMTVAVNSYYTNPAYVKPTPAQVKAAKEAQIAELQASIA